MVMTSKAAIDDFLSQGRIAVVGASRSPRKFGNKVFRELQSRGYAVYPVNPRAEEVEGQKCYPVYWFTGNSTKGLCGISNASQPDPDRCIRILRFFLPTQLSNGRIR